MAKKLKSPEEWFKQAEYDIETADALYKTGRFIYAVFMCHLSIEKALKGLYVKKLVKNPPKIHNLNFLCEAIDIKLSDEHSVFIDNLNILSVPTRYPDDIRKHIKEYSRNKTRAILIKTKEMLECLKKTN